MAFIGVRISWLMLARNMDLDWVASSAALRAVANAVTSTLTPTTRSGWPWALRMMRLVLCSQRTLPSASCTRNSSCVVLTVGSASAAAARRRAGSRSSGCSRRPQWSTVPS